LQFCFNALTLLINYWRQLMCLAFNNIVARFRQLRTAPTNQWRWQKMAFDKHRNVDNDNDTNNNSSLLIVR